MFKGISAICKQYERSGFKGALRFSFCVKDGNRNIDMCEDTTVTPGSNVLPISKLQEICERGTFGWISVYLTEIGIYGFDYKINIQGMSYRRLERECREKCSAAKIVLKKLNS